MKRFFATYIITIMLFSFDSNGQNKTNHDINSFFIIPQNHKSLICKLENNKILELDSFPKNIDSKSIIVNDEFICSIDSLISVFDIKGNLLKEIKPDFEVTCLNSKGKIAFFGGKSNEYETKSGEIFAILDLEKKNFKIKKIKIPIDIKYGKAIDDILILNNKLLLVDDIVFPKYLLEYDITDAKKPKHIETKELENNGTYEHIVKGELNENWIVLLSSTIGMGGASDHIVVEGKTKGHIALYRGREFSLEKKSESKEPEGFNDICLIDNELYILVDSTVYLLNLNTKISIDEMKMVGSKLNSIKKIIRVPNNEIILISHNNNYDKIIKQ